MSSTSQDETPRQRHPTRRQALYWAQQGWPVIPCKPDKSPYPEHGKDEATTDEIQIARWWAKWPFALVGGRCDGKVVLDLDSYKPGHATDLARLPDLPPTRTHRTRGGGTHLIFLDSAGLFRSGKLGPTIDVRAGTSRDYVILPAPGTGYEVERDQDPIEAPAVLREFVGSPPVNAETPGELPDPEDLPDGYAAPVTGKDDSEHTYWLIYMGVQDGLTDGQLLTLAEQDPITSERREAVRRQQPHWWPGEFWRCVIKARRAPKRRQKPMTADDRRFRSDMGNAAWFASDHADAARYVPEIGWFVWDGRLWQPGEGKATELAKQTVRDMWARAFEDEERDVLSKHAAKSQEAARIAAMLRLARSDPAIEIGVADLDADPFLLTCGNGTVDLRTGELLPFEPGHLITAGSDVTYDQGTACPMWDEWLGWFCGGDQELAAWLRLAAGFTLIGSTGAQQWILLYGGGSNGKTTFVLVLAGLLGGLAVAADAEMLSVARKQGGHSEAIAALRGARMVHLAETSSEGRWDEALIKQLTGGEPISASAKGKPQITFDSRLTLWASGNHKPLFRDDSDGFWRRVKLVEQTRKVPPANRQPDYHKTLLAKEGPGILAWAVAGAQDAARWLQSGGELREPPAVRLATEQYRRERDEVGRFCRDNLKLEKDGLAPSRLVWNRYQAWSRDEGVSFAKSQAELVREAARWFAEKDLPVTASKSNKRRGLRGAVLRGRS